LQCPRPWGKYLNTPNERLSFDPFYDLIFGSIGWPERGMGPFTAGILDGGSRKTCQFLARGGVDQDIVLLLTALSKYP